MTLTNEPRPVIQCSHCGFVVVASKAELRSMLWHLPTDRSQLVLCPGCNQRREERDKLDADQAP
jgi:hypothetical protein